MRRRSRSAQTGRSRTNRVAQLALHGVQIAGSSLVREGPFAHHEGTKRRMPDIRRVVYSLGKPVNRVEVFGKGIPRPFDTRVHRRTRDVFGAFEITDHQ